MTVLPDLPLLRGEGRGEGTMAIRARDSGYNDFMPASANPQEAAVLNTVSMRPASYLSEVVEYLNGRSDLPVSRPIWIRYGSPASPLSRISRTPKARSMQSGASRSLSGRFSKHASNRSARVRQDHAARRLTGRIPGLATALGYLDPRFARYS